MVWVREILQVTMHADKAVAWSVEHLNVISLHWKCRHTLWLSMPEGVIHPDTPATWVDGCKTPFLGPSHLTAATSAATPQRSCCSHPVSILPWFAIVKGIWSSKDELYVVQKKNKPTYTKLQVNVQTFAFHVEHQSTVKTQMAVNLV